MNYCACGCGETPDDGGNLRQGHDLRVSYALVKYLTSMTVRELTESRPDLVTAAMTYKERNT